MSRIISYKGKMEDNTQDKIFLATNNGLTGYTINKFELMPKDPEEDIRSTVKIYAVEQSSISENIDFNESDLLATGIIRGGTGVGQPLTEMVVFDNVKVNQNIFVTCKGSSYTVPVNYYIELKESKLSLDEQSVATLKNIRNNKSQ